MANTKSKSKSKSKSKTKKSVAKAKVSYNCSRCNSTCCTFPEISLSKEEMKPMAEALGITTEQFKKKYTKRTEDKTGWQFRHKKHDIHGSICVFHDPKVGCSMYSVRPSVCRDHPGPRCSFYDFLTAMRKHCDDPEYFPTQFRY